MTASTSARTPRRTSALTSASTLTFAGVVHSEWIKLRTLRSTVWSYAVIVLISVGLAALMSSTVGSFAASVPESQYNEYLVQASTFGLFFGQLVSAVLGVLVISGEYSTGMIRSTFTAVPRRLPALWAKAIVFLAATFVVGIVSVFASMLVAAPALAGAGIHADFGDAGLYTSLAGGALYLTLMGLVSLGIGTMLRSAAGGIAASLGLILVLPIIVPMIPADWAMDVAPYLPSNAGQQMFGLSSMGVEAFEPWQALLVVLAWVAAALLGGALLLKRRDA